MRPSSATTASGTDADRIPSCRTAPRRLCAVALRTIAPSSVTSAGTQYSSWTWRVQRASTPAAQRRRASSWKTAVSPGPAAPMRQRQPANTTIQPKVLSLQRLRCAARLAIPQRACSEQSSVAIAGLNAPRTVGPSFDSHEAGLVGRDNTPDQCSRRGRRVLGQLARQRNIGPRAAVSRYELSRLRCRITYYLEQVDVARYQRLDIRRKSRSPFRARVPIATIRCPGKVLSVFASDWARSQAQDGDP